MRDWRCREDQQNSVQVSRSSWTTCHLIAWSIGHAHMFGVPYRSFVICAGKKTNKNKTNVRHAHVIFYVFNQLQATGGSCSHICKCKVAPHHPFVQTCIHAYADGHSLLSRWLSCPPTHPRANYSSTIRKRHVDIRQFHLHIAKPVVIIGEYDCSESNKSPICLVGCAEDFSFGVSLYRYDVWSFFMLHYVLLCWQNHRHFLGLHNR